MWETTRLVSVVLPSGRRLAGIDFALQKDITMADGTVMKKGKKYFTFDEANALVNERKLPFLETVPTEDEFYQAISMFRPADGDTHTAAEILGEALDFKLNGWIVPGDMDRYNADPENFTDVKCLGDCGCYLSDTECCKGVSVLCLGADGYVGVECGGKGYGFSLRSVLY